MKLSATSSKQVPDQALKQVLKQGPKQLPKQGLKQGMSIRASALVAAALMILGASGLIPVATKTGNLGPQMAEAQNFGQRTIQGKVIDDREAHVPGATVFLKNVKSRSVKSFTSTEDGSFRFAQVGMVDDYEVWAEQGKRKSAVKSISSFDSRKTVDYELKLK